MLKVLSEPDQNQVHKPSILVNNLTFKLGRMQKFQNENKNKGYSRLLNIH